MKEPKFDWEFDDRWNATLVVTCPQCGRKLRRRLQELRAGSTVECVCGGFSFVFTDSNLRAVQRQIDELRRDFKKLGK